jgi:predicted small metal-binding protein
MTKEIACTNVVPGCGFTADAATEEELLAKVAEHARVVHGVSEVTPELVTKVRAAITEKR